MRSQALRNVSLITGAVNLTFLLLLAFAVCFVSVPVFAQSGAWQVDGQHSVARLSLGRGSNTFETGLARVSGEVVFDSNEPGDPSIRLKITADNGLSAEYPKMSFTSKRWAITSDGNLAVTGDLSVSRVERSVALEANEAYAGPQYGDPVTVTDARQITLLFRHPRRLAGDNGVMQLSGTTSVSREAFPQLLDALTLENWPTQLVNNKECRVPSTTGENYSGAKCTGTEIATVSNRVVPTGAAGGEGYDGFKPDVAPDRDRATIALDLKLTQRASATSSAEDSAGH